MKNSFGLVRAVRLGVRSLLLHRLRSLLTTLGVLFGTSSVIAMLAIGEGASAEAQDQIRALGSQNIILRSIKPATQATNSNQSSRVSIYGLTHADHRRIEQTYMQFLNSVVPVRELAQEVRNGPLVEQPRVLATTSEYVKATSRRMLSGRFLSDLDEISAANVCVLGSELARRLFPFSDPVGQQVKVGVEYYDVIGMLAPRVLAGDTKGRPMEGLTDELFLPLSTGKKYYGELLVRSNSGSRDIEQVQLHELVLGVKEPELVLDVADATREMLGRFHDEGDYEVIVPLEELESARQTKRIFNIVLGSIAGISLLVGGIGIMNVMLATVTERTREIGIRRALGAKRKHIVSQFLVECVVLSVGGGAVGVLLGLAIPIAVEHFAGMRTVVTPLAPILAFCISAGVGVLFGLYPAWRAATMDPVEALRHE